MESSRSTPKEFQHPLPLTARQPFRALWLVLGLSALMLVRLPIWCISYLLPSQRQNPKWTWKQAMLTRLINFHWYFTPPLRPQFTKTPEQHEGDKAAHQIVDPLPESQLRGVLASDQDVKPVPRPATWWPEKYNAERDQDKNVILYCFGGAYVVGDPNPKIYQSSMRRLCSVLNGIFFNLGYRLASTQGQHFPAQLQDVLAAYQHLLSQGISSSRIILLGDSAGGHLIISLLRYMTEYPEIPLPCAAILDCPWVDLTSAGIQKLSEKRNVDILKVPVLEWGISAFIPADRSDQDPYISPLHHPFKIPVPTWIHADRSELIYDSIHAFYEALKTVSGNNVQFFETEGTIHTLLMWGLIWGFQEQFDLMIEDLHGFAKQHDLLTR